MKKWKSFNRKSFGMALLLAAICFGLAAYVHGLKPDPVDFVPSAIPTLTPTPTPNWIGSGWWQDVPTPIEE